jgi:hypothetical protein
VRLGLTTLLTVAAACGDSHSVSSIADAGSDAPSDAGPVVTVCDFGTFDLPPGTSCLRGLEACAERDLTFCIRRSATCPAGELVFDETDRWGFGEMICEPTGAVALTGSGPSGPFTLSSGAGSFSHYFAVDARLIFLSGDLTSCEVPALVVPLTPIGPESTYEGSHGATAELYRADGAVELLTGSTRIDTQSMTADGLVALTGEADLAGAFSGVRGSFSIHECRGLDRSSI